MASSSNRSTVLKDLAARMDQEQADVAEREVLLNQDVAGREAMRDFKPFT